jgi:hypothetical protein
MEDSTQLAALISCQQKMSEDIGDIKATVKEAASIITFVRRDQDELKVRLDRLEIMHNNCPARQKMNAWSMGAKDIAWLLALVGGILSVWYGRK